MKIVISILLFFLFSVSDAQESREINPKLTGPYLGQKPPCLTPEIFAPGTVSRDGIQSKLLITPDGSEIIFMNIMAQGSSPADRKISFVSFKMKNGSWDPPANIPFSLEYINDEPALSPDGKKLYFVSTRPESGEAEAQKLPDIWVVERTDEGWGVPHILGAPVNTEGIEVQPFCSTDDKLYFGRYDGLYYSQFINGQFSNPVRLNENIFKGRVRGICISPDNNTLVVHSDKPGGSGSWDLYASFRDPAGEWTELVNMGKAVNTDLSESNATFSPDGKYLFFSRDDDIYWISAGIFEKIKTN